MKFNSRGHSSGAPQKSWNSSSPGRGGRGGGGGAFRGGGGNRGRGGGSPHRGGGGFNNRGGGFNNRGGGFNRGGAFRGRGGGDSFRGGRGNPRHSFGNEFKGGYNANDGKKESKSAPNTPMQKGFNKFSSEKKKFEDEEMDSGMNSDEVDDEAYSSDDEDQKSLVKSILKSPNNASSIKKSVGISAVKSPSATTKTPSTPHPSAKKATAVVEPQKHKLNFEEVDDDEEETDEEDSEEEDSDEESDEEEEEEEMNMDDKKFGNKKGVALIHGNKKNAALMSKSNEKTKDQASGKSNEVKLKPKLAFPTDSDDESEMESDEDEDELENEDEDMSEFSDEEEESDDETSPLKDVAKKNTNIGGKISNVALGKSKQPIEASSGSDEEESDDEQPSKIPVASKKGDIMSKAAKSATNIQKHAQGKSKAPLALPSDSDEEEDESDDEDESESGEDESESEQHKDALFDNTLQIKEKKDQGKPKMQVTQSSDSDEDEEVSDEEDEEEELSDIEPVTKKPKVLSSIAKKPVAVVTPLEQSSIVKEEERRRQDRNSRSLFVKGIPPSVTDSDLKNLNSDCVQVRRRNTVAWLLFATKEASDKAKAKLSEVTLKGESKPLFVDFCDERSSKKPEESTKPSKSQQPVNPLELCVLSLPKGIKKEQLEVVFKTAVHISLVSGKLHLPTRAFVRFDDEKAARDAFEKSKNLKISGEPVDVFYSRIFTKESTNQNLPKHKQQQGQKGSQSHNAKAEIKMVGKEMKKAQPSKKPLDKSANQDKGFPQKTKPLDSIPKGIKRPLDQKSDHGIKKQKKPRL